MADEAAHEVKVDLAEELTSGVKGEERVRSWPNLKPKDAATLIVIDRSGPRPKVLMGRRHPGHRFMPGKFVFPGGRLERDDRRMPAVGDLPERAQAALAAQALGRSAGRGRALALTAIRETYEETGLLLGRAVDAMPSGPRRGAWAPFFERGVLPDLSAVAFVGRAITPPKRPKRFDTRFFAIDRELIAREEPGFVGPDSELVELAWVEIGEARGLDLPTITAVMLKNLEERLEVGFGHDHPAPFYRETRGRFVRALL